jgi:hypothetical protein
MPDASYHDPASSLAAAPSTGAIIMSGQLVETATQNANHLDLCYFCWTQSGWIIEREDDTLLGGPFAMYWEARSWAIEKEFVEPEHCGYVDEFDS